MSLDHTQVFLCYDSADADEVVELSKRLQSAGFQPWMDRTHLVPGDDWHKSIQRAIRDSEYFIICLTSHSVTKRGYLQKEIAQALELQQEKLENDRYIIPVRLEPCDIPDRIVHLQPANLYEGDGWSKLLTSLGVGSEGAPTWGAHPTLNRATHLSVGGVPLPCFFPSTSGAAKNTFSPLDHLKILRAVEFPQFLTSAFDIARAAPGERQELNQHIARAAQRGHVILLDSGVYERRWLRTRWLKREFDETVRNISCHLAFCYDNPTPTKGTIKQRADQIIKDVARDRRKAAFQAIMPIVHAARPDDFPGICERVVKALDPAVVAIPERELGDGIFQAARTVLSVRATMNRSGQYYPLHILGTGNPLSILVYAASGADAFDGLDWCQTVVDHDTGILYHSNQFDFFHAQTDFGTDGKLPFFARLLAHNLVFYRSWMDRIRGSLNTGRIHEICEEYLPDHVQRELSALLDSS